jgi:GGDEF domain-containing protein
MAIAGPRRRRSDSRSPRPLPFGPTPGQIGPPDPAGVLRSLEHALDAARRARRPMTLVALELPPPAGEEALSQVARLVRNTVRDTDGLWRDGERSLVLLLTDADGPNSEPALARLRLRLRAERLNAVLMGRAAPPPGIGAADLLTLARDDCRPIAQGGHRQG